MELHLDFESYYSTEQKYDLKSISMTEYIRDPRFKAFGAGIAFDDMPIHWVSGSELQSLFDHIKWNEIDLIGQNVKFDGAILAWKYGYTPRSYIDTKGMSRAVLGKSIKNHSLATLAEHFKFESKGHLQTNGLLTLTAEQEKELADYCIHDVELERAIYNKLKVDFPISQYASMDQTIRMFVEPKLQLNIELLNKTAIDEAKRRETIFNTIGISKAEFASNKKFPDLLIKKGYEVPTKVSPRTGKTIPALALGDTEFIELMETEDEELKLLCEARIAAKSTLLETRSTKLASIGRTGFWPFDVEFSGADQTHRFSGGSGAGGNPQNFTRASALRESVEAPENYELVVGDFSSIELRLVAYLSKDPGLLEAIETGKNPYCDFASVFYGRTVTKYDKITGKETPEYRFGKAAILGLGYGMGYIKFIKTVRSQTGQKISEDVSKKAVNLYRTRYGYVQALWNMLGQIIPLMQKVDEKYQTTLPIKLGFEHILLPSGLKIRFPNLRLEEGDKGHDEWIYDVWVKGHLERRRLYGGKLLENICQGLAGELCKEAMVKLGHDVVGQVHDELHLICRKGTGTLAAQNMRRIMSLAPDWMPEMILDAEVKVGVNWGDCK